MTKLFRYISSLLLILTLSACATGVKYEQTAQLIPPPTPEQGRIVIYRKSIAGSRIQPNILLNNEVVGKAKPRGFFNADLRPGRYEITAETQAKGSVLIDLNAGDVVYVRLNMKMGFTSGRVEPVVVELEVAQEDLKLTRFIGNAL